MIDDIRVIDLDQRHYRAVAIARVGAEIIICLAIRRYYSETNRDHYWCFYVGLTEEQFRFLRSLEDDSLELSYLGIAGDSISVPKLLCDRYLLTQPTYFAGIDVNRNLLGQASSEEIVAFLSAFCDSVMQKVLTRYAA